jgi:small redox-active disulfide protein 2
LKEEYPMKIEVLGTGCRRCDQLYEFAQEAAAKSDSTADIEVVKVADVNYFLKMGVFVTPGLVIDGQVISAGKLLTVDEILAAIKENT